MREAISNNVKRRGLHMPWGIGAQSWDAALSRPRALITFFLLATGLPFVTQYFVDNYGWTGGEYWLRIATTCAIFASLTLALNLVLGYTGLWNIGFIAYFGIGSYTYALVASDQLNLHLGVFPALAVVVLVIACFALLVGLPALRLRGDYLAIVTLAFGLIMQELTFDLDRPPVLMGHQFGPDTLNITGGTNGLHQVDPFRLPDNFPLIHGTALQTQDYYWIALGLAALFAYCSHRWRNTRTGRAWMAIREDQLVAGVMGINTYGYRLLAFTVSAVMAGISGMVYAAWLHNAFPENFDFQQQVLVYIMLILGGLASIPGAILGAIVVTVVPFMLQPIVFYKLVIFSLMLIVLMIFRPQGLMGLVSLRPRRQLGGTLELFTEETEATATESSIGPSAGTEGASGVAEDASLGSH